MGLATIDSHSQKELTEIHSNSLVDETPLPKITGQVRLKSMVVLLDRNFITRVPDNLIRHSRELKLRKRVAEQQETISLLGKALDLLLEQ